MNANLTKNVGTITYLEYVCTESFTEGIHHHLIFLSTFGVFLCIFTCLGNALILVALRKESTLASPSKLLLRSLATSDLCVGVFSDPIAVIYWVSAVNERWSVCYYAFATEYVVSYALCTVSLLTTCAISVDRLLALLLGLGYRETVTLKRVCGVIISFWVLATVHSAVSIKSSEFAAKFNDILVCICVAISMFSNAMIFFNLRKHRIRSQDRRSREESSGGSQNGEVSMAKHKRAVASVLWIQLTFVICYLPYPVIVLLLSTMGELSQTLELIRQYALVLVFVNSSLNPLLYCWKITEIRQAVVATLKKWRCSSTD